MRLALLLASFLGDASTASASEAGAGQAMMEREAEVSRRALATHAVARWHGEYRLVRDVYFAGPAGMVSLAQRSLEASARWVQEAHGVVEMVRAARGQLRDRDVQASLRERVRALHVGRRELRASAAAVRERGATAARRLAQLGGLPPAIAPGYEQSVAFLLARGDELARAIDTLASRATEAEQLAWEATLAPLAAAVGAAVRAEALGAPELACELGTVSEAVAADADLYPHVAEVDAALRGLQAMVLTRRYFAARRAMAALAAASATAAAAIGASPVDPVFQREPLAAVGRAHAAGEAAWRSLTASSMAPWQVVADHLERQSRVLASRCRDPLLAPQLNCALLSQFIGLDPARVAAMSEAELELVEQTLARVADGPLS